MDKEARNMLMNTFWPFGGWKPSRSPLSGEDLLTGGAVPFLRHIFIEKVNNYATS